MENPDDSPYCGEFAGAAFGRDLDYHNGCVLDYITDVCAIGSTSCPSTGSASIIRWASSIPAGPGLVCRRCSRGCAGTLISTGARNFPLILEHAWDYTSIDVGEHGWRDQLLARSSARSLRQYLTQRQIQPGIMRLLDAARDFAASRTAVTYLENHDHESIMLNAGSREEWVRVRPYAIALLTAAGAPMLHNGQEFAELYPMPENDGGAPADLPDPAQKRVVPRPLRWGARRRRTGRGHVDALSAPHCPAAQSCGTDLAQFLSPRLG